MHTATNHLYLFKLNSIFQLQYFVSNFDTVATCASFLAGFSYSSLGMSEFVGLYSGIWILETAFHSSVAIAFGSNFLCFILALQCRIRGVGLAVKGPAGSMHQSIGELRRYQVRKVL